MLVESYEQLIFSCSQLEKAHEEITASEARMAEQLDELRKSQKALYEMEATRYAQTLIEMFRMPWHIEGKKFYSTISVGISIFPDNGNDVNVLLKKADMAMYKAKECGRNSYRIYEDSMYAMMAEKPDANSNMRNQ